LREKGVETGRLDAELLLSHLLGVKRLDLYLQHDRPLKPSELDSFKRLLLRRAAREPIQYIIGTVGFRDLELATDRRALIPRPETEVLVGEVLSWASRLAGASRLRALEVGTGTGAIALSLATEGPFCRIVATDISQAALDLASENARRVGAEDLVEFRLGALFEPVRGDGRFHVVVSNPPYVAMAEASELQPEVGNAEPKEALFAGQDGLDVLIPLVRGAADFLLGGGLLAVEVGEGQAAQVADTARNTGAFREIRIVPDLAGKDRFVLGVALD
jgi:release factor glutamine methyltransferase